MPRVRNVNQYPTAAEQAAIAQRVEELTQEQMACVVVNPWDAKSFEELPERLEGDVFDLLTAEKLRRLVDAMVEHSLSLEVAAKGVGIPARTARQYFDRGCEDLQVGIPSRFAFFSHFVGVAEFEVQKALVTKVKTTPIGWQNYAFLLERMFPEFSAIKQNQKERAESGIQEKILKQLAAPLQHTGPVDLPPLPPEPDNPR